MKAFLLHLFGAFIKEGQKAAYLFYEYETNEEEEYTPKELGFPGTTELFGKSTKHEALLFLGYGLTDRVALELEAALWSKEELITSPHDESGAGPSSKIEESGLGEVEAQARYLLNVPTKDQAQYYGYSEVIFPFQKNKKLIGASDWKVVQGLGAYKSFGQGLLLGRFSIAYDFGESDLELAEYAIEYYKDISSNRRYVVAIEGEDDEIGLIGELQWLVGVTPW